MGFQVNGNTFIDNTGSAIFNANTIVANNFSVQLTPFVSRESTSPMQGTVAGFTAGGNDGSSPPVETNVIDKFPFANELTAVDHGDLQGPKRLHTSSSSDTQGFVAGGYFAPVSPANLNIIDKFPFATNTTASDHGDLGANRRQLAGHSSTTQGFVSGGIEPPPARVNTVEKYNFASNVTASDHGDLVVATEDHAGQSSETHGYATGGLAPSTPNTLNTITKFAFDTNTTASDIGDLTVLRTATTGDSSKSHGYTLSGFQNPPLVTLNVIDKFPFSSDTNATDVGDTVDGVYYVSGQNSREHGYISGGAGNSFYKTMIQRFPFAIDTNASDVGDLTQARGQNAGAQD